VTRETAASSVGPGHDRPERAPACLAGQAGAAAAADDAHDRPRPDQTSRRVIDPAGRPDAPAANSGLPARRDLRTHGRHRHRAMAPLCQAPGNGADITGLVRMTRWTRTRLDRHRRRYAGAGGAIGVSGGRRRVRGPGGRSV